MYELKDNFLSDDDFTSLKNLMIGGPFPWYYNIGKVHGEDGTYQFTHAFYDEGVITSDHLTYLQPIIEKFKAVALLRIKGNLTTKEKKTTMTPLHCDGQNTWGIREGEKDWLTSIFYVNTNNGYTGFEDGTKVESIANRLITFPCSIKHAGAGCTDENIRVVINFNYII